MASAALPHLLDDLARRGVNLSTDGDHIRFRPSSVVPESIREMLQQLKPELLALLRTPGADGFQVGELAVLARAGFVPADVPEAAAAKTAFAAMGMRLVGFNPKARANDLPPDWREMLEERAAVMEFDGNLPRERAEQLALADIFALMRGRETRLLSEVR